MEGGMGGCHVAATGSGGSAAGGRGAAQPPVR